MGDRLLCGDNATVGGRKDWTPGSDFQGQISVSIFSEPQPGAIRAYDLHPCRATIWKIICEIISGSISLSRSR